MGQDGATNLGRAGMRLTIPLGGTDWGQSGIGIYVRAIIPELLRLAKAGSHELVAMGTQLDLTEYASVLRGIECQRLSAPDSPLGSAMFYLSLGGREVRRARSDVLLLPAATRRTLLKFDVPTVSVVHDLAQLHISRKYDPLRMMYFRRFIVPSLRNATIVVAVSHATRRDLEDALGESCPPICVVPNGVDYQRYALLKNRESHIAATKKHLGIAGPYLLYASRLEHPGKNHLRLLRAYMRSRAFNSHLLVLSGKDWGAESLIRAELTRLGCAHRVMLLGFVPSELMPGLVAGADGVLTVGLREGFGLPALEALAAGRPVCAAQTGAIPEVVGPLATLCDPFNELSMVNSLDRLLCDHEFRRRAEIEGPAWAQARGWSVTASALIEACEEAMNR